MKSFKKIMKKTGQVLLYLLLFAIPVAMMVCFFSDASGWWLAALAGLGVLVVVSWLWMVIAAVAAEVRKSIRRGKPT